MSVRVALNATFYFDGGDVFVMDEDPDETVAQLGQRAVVLKGAGSNQTEKECFVRFLVFHGGEFVEQSKKTTEFSRDDVFYIRDIGREGSYETAIEKKIEGIPLAIYIRTAPNIKGSKLRDGWFPAYPKFTVGQFKTFILSLTNYFGANFWMDGQLLSNNSKMCKTIMKNGTVIVVSSDSENVAEDMGSPIFEASGYAPSLDMFQLPTLPPVRARDADTDSSAVETDSEDGCTAIPITLTNPYTGEIDKVMYPQNMTLGELMKKMHLTYYEPEPDASMPATIQVAFPFASHDCAVPAYSTVPSSGEATLVELNQKMDGMKSVEILMDVGSVKRRYLYWYDGSARFEHLFELLRENGIDVGGLRDDPPPSYILKGSRSTAMRHEIVSDWGFNAVGFGIVPYLAGGGKDVKKTEMKNAFVKQQKKIASDNLLQSTRAKSSYVKAEAINMFPQYHELTGMVDDMVTKASISGSQGLEAVITGCSSIESLQEALQILDTKVARTNSIDHRVRLCGKHLMGEPMKNAVETQKSMETIIDVAQTAFLHVFMKCSAEITSFDVSNLKVMLSNRISFLEGQQAQSSGDADALATGLGGMNIS